MKHTTYKCRRQPYVTYLTFGKGNSFRVGYSVHDGDAVAGARGVQWNLFN